MKQKRRKRSNIIIVSLCAIVLCMAVGYAAFSSVLDIKGTSSITSTWDVEITSAKVKGTKGEAENVKGPTFDSLSATMEANFYVPGDAITYEVTVSNLGTLDAVLDSIKINLEDQNVILFTVDGINSGEELLKGASKTFNVTLKYNEDITSQPSLSTVSFTMNMNYLQKGNSSDFSDANVPSIEQGLAINSIELTPSEKSISAKIIANQASIYYYSIDNDKWYESINNTYTINDLKPYTDYTVYVKAEDDEGNVVVSSKQVKTTDTTNPTINYKLGTNTVGENNWYKELNIEAEVKDNDQVKEALYCITTNDSCTPDKKLTLTNNKGTIALESNSKKEKVCITASDRKGNNYTKCSDSYQVDSINPTVDSLTLTPDDDTMTITVTGTDAHSGLYTYYYSKDGGETYVSSSNPNYTFTSLEEGDYLVTVYVLDKAGNKSELAAKTTTIRHASFCAHNDINDLGDCVVATEAGNKDVATAKTAIKEKGTPNFTVTSPSITYSETHGNTTSNYDYTTFHNIGTGYTFNTATGYYTLKNYTLKDPTTVDYSTGDYYTCISTNTSCTTLYKIVGASSTVNSSTGVTTYRIVKYNYGTSIKSYDTSESGLYAASDDNGTSYYYRGAVGGNYVKFADKYFRIIRVNGDGTVRMIYDGTTAHQNGEASSNRQVTTSAFNSWWSDNSFVGYMYGNNSSNQITEYDVAFTYTGLSNTAKYYFGTSYTYDKASNAFKLSGDLTAETLAEYNTNHNTSKLYSCFSTSSTGTCQRLVHIQRYVSPTSMSVTAVEYSTPSYEKAHANETNSTMKNYLDNWYKNNLNTYNDKVSKEAVFCNDRTKSSQNSGSYRNTGYGITPTIYGYDRFYTWVSAAKGPRLTCPQNNDKFTVSSTTGNGALTYPVGLITADEVNMAGGKTSAQNLLYYLYSGTTYWTMSPSLFNHVSLAREFVVTGAGELTYSGVHNGYGFRPVINLDPKNLTFTGSGTMEDPFVVS